MISTLLVLVGTVVGVVLMEVAWRVYSFAVAEEPVYHWKKRIMFFEGEGSIFRNVNRIFTYVPNSTIHSRAVYFSDSDYVVEYDYRFRTNNFGLVQDNDLVRRKKSVLLLGDSFTEGQGAEPWFRQLRPQIERFGYQAINGGIFGTGFLQWWHLHHHLSENGIAIEKLVVLFISGDYIRPVWNFPDRVLRCTTALEHCDGSEGYYRLPPPEREASWVSKIREVRTPKRTAIKPPTLKEQLKRAAPATYQVYRLLKDWMNTASAPPSNAANEEWVAAQVIAEMVARYGVGNVVFVHLPQKHELDEPTAEGLRVRQAIASAGGQLVDGFKQCGLTPDDYFEIDGHPNPAGYNKIVVCVSRTVEAFLSGRSDAAAPSTNRYARY
jgi:hypothetical protein